MDGIVLGGVAEQAAEALRAPGAGSATGVGPAWPPVWRDGVAGLAGSVRAKFSPSQKLSKNDGFGTAAAGAGAAWLGPADADAVWPLLLLLARLLDCR